MPGDHIQLSDGRRLDLKVGGDPGGLPLVFHHGTPGAAPPPRALERAALQRGLRLVAMSRPGYGSSSRHRGRRVVDVVGDTRAVLAALGATRCVVAGWSGGGPHALACAAGLDGVAACLVIAGIAPFGADGLEWMDGMGEENVAEFGMALRGEDALRGFLQEERPHLLDVSVEQIVASLGTLLPDVDRAVFTDEFGEDMAAGFHEALRTGVDGWLDDDLAFAGPWGFELEDITGVPVAVWQGSADMMVPFAHGQWLSAAIPGASAHLLKGEGHLSIGLGALDQMLDELLAAAGSS